MNARPRRGDSEARFHCADVTPTLVQCHTSQNVTKTSAVSRLHAVADLAHHPVLGRPETGLTHARFARSRVEAGAAYRSFVSFEGSFWLFRWHLPAPDNGEQRLPGGIMSRAGSLEALARANPARLMVARARQCWWRTAGRSWWVFPPHPARTRRAFSGCDARGLLCGPAARSAPLAAPRRAALLDCVGAVAPGGVKREVAIARVIRPALR